MSHLHHSTLGLYMNGYYTPVSVAPKQIMSQLCNIERNVGIIPNGSGPLVRVTFTFQGVKAELSLSEVKLILRPMSEITQDHVAALCKICCPNTPERYWHARSFGTVAWWQEHGMAESADGSALGVSPAADCYLRENGFDRGGYVEGETGLPVWVNSLLKAGAAVTWGGGV